MNVLPFSLLMKEFDPSADSNEAIRLASNIGHHGCVSLLWADPRVRERNGCVSLLWADPRVRERRVTRALQKAIEKSLAHS